MKIFFLIILLAVLNSISTAQNSNIDSTANQEVKVKLIVGLPQSLQMKFDSPNSSFFYAIVSNVTTEQNSFFVYEKKEDGEIACWWIDNSRPEFDAIRIYANEFSTNQPVFVFDTELNRIKTTRKIILEKTEAITYSESSETYIPFFTSFYISSAVEFSSYLSRYRNNIRDVASISPSKTFWKFINTNSSGIPITTFSLGLKTLLRDVHALEIKIAMSINEEAYSGLDFGLFYNRFWKPNFYSFVGAQLHNRHLGSAPVNAIYFGGGIGYGLNEWYAITFSGYLVDNDKFYYSQANSNISWRGLFKLGFQFNY